MHHNRKIWVFKRSRVKYWLVIQILYKNRLSNNYIRNILNNIVYSPARFFWSSVFGDVNCCKAWWTVDKFYINNKVKEVHFKIMHRIYSVKHTVCWNALNYKLITLVISVKAFTECIFFTVYIQINVIIYFGDHGYDKNKAYFIQLLILMGKFYIHKIKWLGFKPNFSNFIKDFKLYCKVLCNCTSKKAIRTHNIVSRHAIV